MIYIEIILSLPIDNVRNAEYNWDAISSILYRVLDITRIMAPSGWGRNGG